MRFSQAADSDLEHWCVGQAGCCPEYRCDKATSPIGVTSRESYHPLPKKARSSCSQTDESPGIGSPLAHSKSNPGSLEVVAEDGAE